MEKLFNGKSAVLILAAVLTAALMTACGGSSGAAQSGNSKEATQIENVEEMAQSGSMEDSAQDETAQDESAQDETAQGGKQQQDTGTSAGSGPVVEIVIKDYGTVKVQLDEENAPITTANFEKLVGEGFYDGLTFHRIIAGFMMQGGDPNGNGTGGSPETIKGEFSSNGVDNPLSHTRGAISMARSSDPDSASSQFFIVHQDSTFLDGDYAVFGYVTEGMDVVDKICEEAQPVDGNGSIAREAQPVIESISIVSE